jgi:uncharacterized membrane protein
MSDFVGSVDHARVVEAIRSAEARSRAEIRVHVVHGVVDDAQKAAAATFEKLGMTRTAERNGVLILVAPKSRRFAIVGDVGIHEKCGATVWREAAAAMESAFRQGRFTDGLVDGIARAGTALAEHFPRLEGVADENELSDEVSEE